MLSRSFYSSLSVSGDRCVGGVAQENTKLFSLVFLQALKDMVNDDTRRKEDVVARRNAYHWLFNDTRDYVFSFISICRYFGWRPNEIRRMVKRNMRKQGFKKNLHYYYKVLSGSNRDERIEHSGTA